MKSVRVVVALAACSLLPCIPFALFGYAGHDFSFHINAWMDLHTAWQHGQLNPGWAARANFGLGDPRFCFYPPLSFFLGTMLTFCLPLKVVPAAFASIALFLAGLSMYRVSRHYVVEKDRFLAAVLYTCSPYLLLTAINRFAAGELLAAAWLPLVLHCFCAAVSTRKPRAVALFGCFLALMILTNIPATTLTLYLLFFAAIGLSARQRSPWPAIVFGLSSLLSIALTAFYSVPAYAERIWVTPQSMVRFDWMSAFIFIPISHLNHKGFQLSCWIFACVDTALLLVLFASRRRQKAEVTGATANGAMTMLTALGIAAFVFQLPFTAVLWRRLPLFSLIVFPYRFLSILAAVVPLVLLARGRAATWRRPAYLAMAAMACLPLFGYASTAFQFLHRPYESLAGQLADENHGYFSLPEYMPAGTVQPVAWPALPEAAAEKTAQPDSTQPLCQVTAPSLHAFTTQSTGACRVRLALYFYPYWKAYDETGQSLAVGRDSAGLLTVDLPPGAHSVRVAFVRKSRLRTATAALSLITLLLTALLLAATGVASGRKSQVEGRN